MVMYILLFFIISGLLFSISVVIMLEINWEEEEEEEEELIGYRIRLFCV